MDNDDWDLFSIVRKCKATTFTHPSTTIENIPPTTTTTTTTTNNSIISPQNTTLSYFDDFTFTQENSSVLIAPLKSNDFIELEKLIINSNSTPIIPTLTTTIPTSSTPTTITSTTIIIPTTITNTSVHGSNQNSTFFDFPILTEQQHMQPNYLTELEKFILNFTPAATIPTPTFTTPTTPTVITPITTTTTFTTPTPTTIIHTSTTTNTTTTTPTMASAHGTNQNTTFSDFPILIEHQHIQPNQNNQMSVLKPIACTEVTTAHSDHAYNHPSVPKQHLRDHNQLRILLPQTSSRVLPVTHPQKLKSRKRKNNQIKKEFCVIEEKLRDDPWSWRKYGQKSIKGSPHPRSYYKCSTSEDCLARKQVEKSKTEDNTYVVTYVGVHNHEKPRLPTVRETGSPSNIRNMGSPNVEMLQFDHPKNNNAQVLVDQSKIPHLETKLIESHLPVAGEFKSSLNVGNVGSPRGTMLQFDESETNNAYVYAHDDDILIPNMTAMSEDLLLDFNHLNGGALFP